jgi:AcrR family transcriptional regulator
MLSAKGRKPKPPTARDRQRRETERRLLAAARKLFSDYGYQNTAITEIAKAAEVTHALIHAYFNSKAGLLYALLSETNALQDRRAAQAVGEPGTLRERLRRIVTIWASTRVATCRAA